MGRTLVSSVLRQILGVWFGFPCYPQTAEAYRDLWNFKFQPVAVRWSLLISGALFVIFPAASADGSGSLGISALVQRLVEVEFPSKKQIETYWKKLKHIEAECGACAKQSLRVCQSVIQSNSKLDKLHGTWARCGAAGGCSCRPSLGSCLQSCRCALPLLRVSKTPHVWEGIKSYRWKSLINISIYINYKYIYLYDIYLLYISYCFFSGT